MQRRGSCSHNFVTAESLGNVLQIVSKRAEAFSSACLTPPCTDVALVCVSHTADHIQMAMSPTTKTHTHQCSKYGRTFQPLFGSLQPVPARRRRRLATAVPIGAAAATMMAAGPFESCFFARLLGVMELLLHRRADMNSRCFSNSAALGFDPLLFPLLFSHLRQPATSFMLDEGTTGLPKRRYGSGRIPNCNGRSSSLRLLRAQC